MKIATICAPDMHHFIDGIESVFRAGGHEVRRFICTTDRQVRESLTWADVVWAEFANEIAAEASRQGHPALIVRLHSYEAHGENALVTQIDWARVAHLVVTSQHVHDIAKESAPQIANVPTSMFPSAVDTDRFVLADRSGSPGTRIGVVAYVRPEKNPPAWLQIMAKLPKQYTLDVAGELDHPGAKSYLMHAVPMLGLSSRVRFLGHVANEDIPAFWREHDICLSASTREGHPYNVCEAMATGAQPVVHEYLGATKQFPRDCLWKTIDQAVGQIVRRAPERRSTEAPRAWRQYIEDRGYSLTAQAPELLALIETVGGKLEESAGGAGCSVPTPEVPSSTPAPSTTLCSLAMIAMIRGPMAVRWLQRAIDSAKGIYDEVVIVVDSRSMDDDLNFVGAVVVRREFTSFSDQRNYAASLCHGEWIFVLDADDYFETTGDLRDLMVQAPDDVDRIQCIEKTVDENGKEIEVGTAVVAYRRTRCEWRYRGHNELYGSDRTRLQSNAVMVYRHPWSDEGKEHARRTIPLLMQDLAENPDTDPHAPYYLARMHHMLGDFAEVAKWADMAIKRAPKSIGHSPAWYLLTNAIHRLHGIGPASQVCAAGLKLHPMMPDLLDFAQMVTFSQWTTACRDINNPYLATSQGTPKRLKEWQKIAAAHEWAVNEGAEEAAA